MATGVATIERHAARRAITGFAPRAIALLVAFAAMVAAHDVFVTPRAARWGATDQETRSALPGDEIIPNAVGQETAAITISAPVDRVWPWVAQLGQDRGGFYSYDLLENLVGCEMPTDDRLRPDRQAWALGDRLWMYPARKAGGVGFATLRAYVPGRALGFASRRIGTPLSAPEDGSWTMALVPNGAASTRLLVRGRVAASHAGWLDRAVERWIFGPAHFVMQRRMMIGIMQLAEGGDRGRIGNHIQVVLWTVTFAVFVASAIALLLGRGAGRALAALVASGILFHALTYLQPSLPLGCLLVLALAAFAWWKPKRG